MKSDNATIMFEGLPVQTCPYVEGYKFKKCEIRTCKNYSQVTPCQCLEIDRVKTNGNKVISDAELHLFKCGSKGVTTRGVALNRKRAIERAKYLIILHKYLEFITGRYEVQGEDSPFIKGKRVQRAQTIYPLGIKRLKFKNWQWHYVVDPVVLEEFLETFPGGECQEIKIEQLLSTTPLKYNKLLKEIKEARNER